MATPKTIDQLTGVGTVAKTTIVPVLKSGDTDATKATVAEIEAAIAADFATAAQGSKADTAVQPAGLPVKASGAEINTGTDDAKFATSKAIADSKLVSGPASITDGHLAVWDTNAKTLKDGGAVPTGAAIATGAEVNTGTDNAKIVTAKAIADSNIAFLSDIPAAPTRASLGLDTTDSPQFAGINIGAASDTTLTRTGAGDIAVEGNAIYRAGGTDVAVADGGTGASTLTAHGVLIGNGTSAVGATAAGTAGQVLTSGGASADPTWQNAAAITAVTVSQTSHGLSAGNVIKVSGANAFAKAQANSAANAETVGYVTAVADANSFTYEPLEAGKIVTNNVPVATAGTVFFLDPATAGAITSTEPTTPDQISKPVGVIIESGAKMQLLSMRGIGISKSSISTLTDGATPALDASLVDQNRVGIYHLSAAGNRTIGVPSNPVDGQRIIIEHYASGGDRTLSLNTGTGGFKFGTTVTALSATTSGTYDEIGCIYNSSQNVWRVVGYGKGF